MTESLEGEIRTLRSLFWSDRDPEGRGFVPLADAYRRAGDIKQALELLNEGLDRHPQFSPAHVVAARLYAEQGMLAEAEISARSALELDPENVDAMATLAVALDERGEHGEATDVRSRLAVLEPSGTDEAASEEAPEEVPSDVAVDDVAATGEVSSEETTFEEAAFEEATFEEVAADEATFDDVVVHESDPVDGAEVPEGADEPLISEFEPEVVDEATFDDVVVHESSEASVESADVVEEFAALAPDEVSSGDDEFDVMEAAGDEALDPFDEGMLEEEQVTEDEPVADFGALAPDEPVADFGALAPDEPVADFGELAPEEPVADLDALAPDTAVPDIGDLADDEATPDGEAVADFEALAPEEPDSEAVDFHTLAPEDVEVVPTPDAVDDTAVDDDAATPEEEAQADAPADHLVADPIYTRTMAELFVTQGLLDRAVEVLEALVAKAPDDEALVARLREVTDLEKAATEAARSAGTETQEGDSPAGGDMTHEEDEVETLARDLATSGDHEHDVDTPFAWADEVADEGGPAGPTMGDLFGKMLGSDAGDGS